MPINSSQTVNDFFPEICKHYTLFPISHILYLMVLNAPLNIPVDELGSFPICNESCAYSFDYGSSTTDVKHTENYFTFKYEISNSIKATYNNIQLQVQEIRLYHRSLTAYNGESTDFELLIHHIDTQNLGMNVLVSVPIRVQESAPRSKSLTYLESIVDHLPTEASTSSRTSINVPLSLNDFVPYQPYVVAETTFPYPPNNGECTCIYFLPSNSPIISRTVADKLTTVLSSSTEQPERTVPSVDSGEMFYNNVGANHPDQATGDDDIWIDCQPTGDTLISEDELAREQGLTPPDIPFRDRATKFFEEHEWIFWTLISFVGILFMMLLFYVGKKGFSMLKERQARQASSSAGAGTNTSSR